jgi:hypothetical protein
VRGEIVLSLRPHAPRARGGPPCYARDVRLLAALLLLSSCAGLDLDAALARGRERWRAATGLEARPSSVTWRGRHDLSCGAIPRAYGCAYTPSNVIWVSVEIADRAQLERVVTHELGHILGANHVGPGEGILAARYPESLPWISEADVAQVCAVRACAWLEPER